MPKKNSDQIESVEKVIVAMAKRNQHALIDATIERLGLKSEVPKISLLNNYHLKLDNEEIGIEQTIMDFVAIGQLDLIDDMIVESGLAETINKPSHDKPKNISGYIDLCHKWHKEEYNKLAPRSWNLETLKESKAGTKALLFHFLSLKNNGMEKEAKKLLFDKVYFLETGKKLSENASFNNTNWQTHLRKLNHFLDNQ